MAFKKLKQIEEPSKIEAKKDFVVVEDSQIPTQQIRKYIDEDGKEIEVIAFSEALKEILMILRNLWGDIKLLNKK